jgi:hypothetical protein
MPRRIVRPSWALKAATEALVGVRLDDGNLRIDLAAGTLALDMRYGSWPDSLIHLHKELARLGLTERALNGYQSTILLGLKRGIDEDAIGQMHEWWRYDLDRLEVRKRQGGQPAKLRIDVTVGFTSKRNFTLTWKPTGSINDRAGPESDWKHWYLVPGYASWRPENEILLIRDLQHAYFAFESDKRDSKPLPEVFRNPEMKAQFAEWDRQYRRDYRTVDEILLKAAEELVVSVKERLKLSFDVCMKWDVFTEWDEDKRKGAERFDYRMRSWEIENVAERNGRLETEELKELGRSTGISPEKLVKVLNEIGVKKRTGPAPTVATQEDRLTRDLKKAGHKITPSVTSRYLELLKRHRPELFPPPLPPSPPPQGSSTVIPFRTPDRSD